RVAAAALLLRLRAAGPRRRQEEGLHREPDGCDECHDVRPDARRLAPCRPAQALKRSVRPRAPGRIRSTLWHRGGRVRDWLRRTVELQRELAAIAEVDPRWWLLAAGVAFAETRAPSEIYLACDAEPDADTFMGYLAPRPRDVVADAIARARAARTALRELD